MDGSLGAPWFPDEAVALFCSFLGVRDLCRLACVSSRFTERVLTDPDSRVLLSPIEEGARLSVLIRHPNRTVAPSIAIRGPPWLHALARLDFRWDRYPYRLGESKYFLRPTHTLPLEYDGTGLLGYGGRTTPFSRSINLLPPARPPESVATSDRASSIALNTGRKGPYAWCQCVQLTPLSSS